MCGIFGVFGRTITDASVRGALDALAHRGPDGRGVWRGARGLATLAHARLAIVGLERGQQPIASEDGRIVACVNGEFYGWRAIRARLERRGHRFRTDSDSEILVHLYEERGESCLDELRGEFSFILCELAASADVVGDEADQQNIQNIRRVWGVRDRFGVKPLVWTEGPGWVAFASEAKALLASGVAAPQWDVRSLAHAAHHQYLPPDRSLFEGVRQVPPGGAVVWAGGEARCGVWWTPTFEVAPPGASAGEVRAALEEAVALRMQADVPVATCLSGGLDSSAVTALAQRYSEGAEPVTCFGISFEGGGGFDEREAAEVVAAHVGARFVPVVARPDALLDALEDAAWCGEGLAINAHLPAKFLLSREVRRQGFKVVLTGEGADELFGGYPHLLQDARAQDPEAVRQTRASAVARGVMVAEGSAAGVEGGEALIRARLGYVPAFLRAKLMLGQRVSALLSDAGRAQVAQLGDELLGELLASADLSALRGRSLPDQSAHLWARWTLAGYILRTLGDGTEMAHGVEGRTPFLDHELFKVAARATLYEKFAADGEEKHTLRRAVADLLPASTVRRTKQPLIAPPLLASPLARARALELLDAPGLPLLDLERARDLVRQAEHMPLPTLQQHEPALMTALSAAAIHRRFGLS